MKIELNTNEHNLCSIRTKILEHIYTKLCLFVFGEK